MRRKEIVRQLVEAAYALIITIALGKWSIHMAYVERGYKSIGGEYLFILIVYLIAWKAIHYLFDTLEELNYERSCKKKRSRGAVGVQNH